jgi:Fe-S-cluster containining protein
LAQTPLQYLTKNYPKQKDSLSVFLKKFDDQKIIGIQKLVEDASEKAWKEVDCLACANCCKVMTPTFTKKDLKRISAFLGMTETDMYDKWLKTDEDNGDIVNQKQPCQFLDKKTNYCSIYEVRPHDCATFPHFKRKPFNDFNHIHEQNIEYCPATLKMINHLKDTIDAGFEW